MKTTSRKIEFQNITTSRPIIQISKITLYVFFFFFSSEIGLINVWKHHVFIFESNNLAEFKTSRVSPKQRECKDWCDVLNASYYLWKETRDVLNSAVVEEKRDGFVFCNMIALWKKKTWCVLISTTFSLTKEKIWCFEWMQRYYFVDRQQKRDVFDETPMVFFYFKNRHLR